MRSKKIMNIFHFINRCPLVTEAILSKCSSECYSYRNYTLLFLSRLTIPLILMPALTGIADPRMEDTGGLATLWTTRTTIATDTGATEGRESRDIGVWRYCPIVAGGKASDVLL